MVLTVPRVCPTGAQLWFMEITHNRLLSADKLHLPRDLVRAVKHPNGSGGKPPHLSESLSSQVNGQYSANGKGPVRQLNTHSGTRQVEATVQLACSPKSVSFRPVLPKLSGAQVTPRGCVKMHDSDSEKQSSGLSFSSKLPGCCCCLGLNPLLTICNQLQ